MRFHDLLRTHFFHAAVISWISVGSAFSQFASLVELGEKSRLAMEQEKWEQALKYHTEAVTRYGRNQPYESYGAQFGSIYYRKGICEMKLKRWSEALASFEICYRDFPNRGADRGNAFQKMALLKWGEAALGAGQWELAKSRFRKFLDERDKNDDVFPKGAFYINMAVCEYRLGNLVEGNENLEIAIHNKAIFPTPESGIVAAFQAFVGAVLTQKNEQVLLDFIGKNRGELVVDGNQVPEYSTIYLKLAGDILAAGMERAAIWVYQLVPLVEGEPSSGIRLAAMALIHERHGSIRCAFSAYQQLELYGQRRENREDYLYHLIRTAVLIGENDLAGSYSHRFLQDFPTSRHRGELQELTKDSPALPEQPQVTDFPNNLEKPFKKTPELAVAMDLYQDRNYQQAKVAFSKIKVSSSGQPEGAQAAFYEIECLRRVGDFEGMATALAAFASPHELGAWQQRQLAVNQLWTVAQRNDWVNLLRQAEGYRYLRLLGGQRVQVGYLQGLALQNLGRITEALNAYCTAITADAGASEELVREAAIKVMELHLADSEVQLAISQWGSAAQNQASIGYHRLREAAGLAFLFETTFGAGTSLPDPLKKLLDCRTP